MRIIFDPDFDGGYWPGPLRARSGQKASTGEAWAGLLGFRGILETALGLGGLFPSQSERTVTLSRDIRSQSGFWSESASKDSIGSARALLRWIDWLKMHGWDGRPPASSAKAPRLVDLASIAPAVMPGNPDRLSAISAALDKRRPDIESVETFEPRERLLPLWRDIFDKLKKVGVSIRNYSPALPSAKSPSDLRRALSPGFKPAGDGSLTLFRPYNPLGAAESTAAWLRSLDDLSDTVIISPGVVLDEALRRFGLPATGARETANDGPYLQILPLVLAMGWNPPDPQRALELLLLSDGPVPRSVARRLRAALQQWPAVGSDKWNEALKDALKAIDDPDKRKTIQERLASIFKPDASVGRTYPAAALLHRAGMLKKWAAGRLHAPSAAPAVPSGPPDRALSPEDSSPDTLEGLEAVIAQCAAFEKLVTASALDAFTEPQLLKLNIEIAGALRGVRRHEPQAGISSLASPAALAGPARRVIWWDFTLESVPEPFSIPLSRAELDALAAAGVTLTPAADLAANEAERRRRPFALASESLLLVSPRFGEDGEERHPHPLWDEIAIACGSTENLARLEAKRLPPHRPLPMKADPVLPTPAPRRSWSAAAKLVTPPTRHSPTSLQDLVSCSFKWALSYLGKLREPEIAALADNATLLGNLSHEILADVLRSSPPDALSARALADKLFRENGPKLAAPLFLPGSPVQRSFVQKATADSAAALIDILHRANLRVVAVESPVSDKTGPFELAGRLDLLAGDPPVVIDLKWRGESYYRNKLKSGTAAQLAAYALMVRKSPAFFPPVAYFIIQNQRLIASKDAPFPEAEAVEAPPLDKTWEAFLETTLDRLDSVKSGTFEAAAIPLDDGGGVVKKDALADGLIVLAPPCKFCSFGFLCGLEWGGEL